MGISFSCPGSEYDALDLGFEKSTERSVSFNRDNINSIIHSLSFTERADPPIVYSPGSKKMFTDESLSFKGMKADPPILCSPGSRKMVIEGSFSFKGMKAEQFEVHTTFSVSNSNIKKEDSMSTNGFNVPEVHKSQKVITDHCISHTGSLEGNDAVTTLSVENLSVEKEDTTGTGSFTCSKSHEETPTFSLSDPGSPKHEAALKLQKVYKSFRTRRQLADCAILVEQSWWKVLDFALLKHSSYFDVDKPESVISRWSRARIRAAKVGKGLLKNVKAQKLARQHWLEAIDPRHRYGHNLHLYYVHWLKCESKQPFFYWLDVGEGKEVNFEHCPRLRLQQQYIKYLGPKEREAYEVIVEDGKFVYKQNRQFLDTSSGDVDSKWIFVLSTSKILYVGQKKKGQFQHSSFLAGGATSSAGRLVVEQGILKAIWPHSGHYRPTEENFQEFINFLKENNVDLTDIKRSPEEDDEWSSQSKRITSFGSNSSRISVLKTINNYTVETPDLHQDHVSESWLDSSLKEKVKCLNSFSEYEASDDKTPEKTCAHDLIREVNEENNQDSPDNTKKGRTLAEMTDVMGVFEEPNYTNSLSRTRTDSNEELESTSSDFLFHKNNLFTEEKESSISQELILLRINSNKGLNFPQLGKQLSFKWTTGAGPCISCVRDYPSELQFQALEKVNLSPRIRIF